MQEINIQMPYQCTMHILIHKMSCFDGGIENENKNQFYRNSRRHNKGLKIAVFLLYFLILHFSIQKQSSLPVKTLTWIKEKWLICDLQRLSLWCLLKFQVLIQLILVKSSILQRFKMEMKVNSNLSELLNEWSVIAMSALCSYFTQTFLCFIRYKLDNGITFASRTYNLIERKYFMFGVDHTIYWVEFTKDELNNQNTRSENVRLGKFLQKYSPNLQM